MARRVRAYIGLGSNVGDPKATLARAVAALHQLPGARVRGVSRLYSTTPVGLHDQPDFMNAVVALEELRSPALAATFALRAEAADPADVESIGVLAQAFRQANRYHALERLLWRHLAQDSDHKANVRAFDELISLYEGPMKRPLQAQALKRLAESWRKQLSDEA